MRPSHEEIRLAMIEAHERTQEANREFLRLALAEPEPRRPRGLVRYGGTWVDAALLEARD